MVANNDELLLVWLFTDKNDERLSRWVVHAESGWSYWLWLLWPLMALAFWTLFFLDGDVVFAVGGTVQTVCLLLLRHEILHELYRLCFGYSGVRIRFAKEGVYSEELYGKDCSKALVTKSWEPPEFWDFWRSSDEIILEHKGRRPHELRINDHFLREVGSRESLDTWLRVRQIEEGEAEPD